MTDQNAASKYARFLHPSQWKLLPFDDIFATDWRNDDQITYWRQKSRRCAEILVPNDAPSRYIFGAYVFDTTAATSLANFGFDRQIHIEPHIFFG